MGNRVKVNSRSPASRGCRRPLTDIPEVQSSGGTGVFSGVVFGHYRVPRDGTGRISAIKHKI
jgi:hypothetical protein